MCAGFIPIDSIDQSAFGYAGVYIDLFALPCLSTSLYTKLLLSHTYTQTWQFCQCMHLRIWLLYYRIQGTNDVGSCHVQSAALPLQVCVSGENERNAATYQTQVSI